MAMKKIILAGVMFTVLSSQADTGRVYCAINYNEAIRARADARREIDQFYQDLRLFISQCESGEVEEVLTGQFASYILHPSTIFGNREKVLNELANQSKHPAECKTGINGYVSAYKNIQPKLDELTRVNDQMSLWIRNYQTYCM
jgi:hypothetical protein